ncbi:leucine--tRNA ligase [Candidatus Protochlamydia sp. R18]|uniref:leucine--tRNA ligase n=1 Tax=Candidatus Protochlamydia sp. R18 TaxID=1353977 RepID=UPI0005AB3801|nr:leucine--tRNA ligase [Candidatus Protochlamydia sp. R18]
MKYDHQQIEAKWQKFWQDNQTYRSDDNFQKPKYYVLDMFPYPSGAGLHVGHVVGYTATDIIARYMRTKGYNVMHPMGWDSFGLPAEQYAIRTGTHPAESTQENINNYRRQLRALGFSYDWNRELATSDPNYYKWTQWIFTKLYEKGLAYEAEMLVNYCPALGTVLANEEIENGKTKDGGHPVERRPLKQWILKITAYADRLLQDLDLLDWPESLKKLQINWIGKSEGAYVQFIEKTTQEAFSVFTTRPDTLFGVSYLVLAPEHPLVSHITASSQQQAVRAYQAQIASKSDLDRTELNRDKTGVFTGAYAVNPVNHKEIPIWISDYVLMNVGTGAIMAVPAHDERDFEFATTFKLPIIPVYDPVCEEITIRNQVLAGQQCWPGHGVCVNSACDDLSLNGLNLDQAKKIVINWLEINHKGKSATTYKLRDWLFSRQRYWGEPFPLLKFEDGSIRLLDEDELPLCPPAITNYKPTGDGKGPLTQIKEWVEIIDTKTGKKAFRDTNIMPQWAGSCWYYLRFCDPHNTEEAFSPEKEKYWLPVDLYIGGVEHAVLHLLYARFWHKVLYDCGYVHTLEPFQTLRNQGLVVARSYQNKMHAYVEPRYVEQKDGKYFDSRTGEELTSQIDKMSKSKLNGESPDEIIQEYGADALRLYEMFMGPLEKEKVWNTDAVSGTRRFLNRFYEMAFSDKVTNETSEEGLKLGHRLVHSVTKDMELLQFNTAIAKMMEFINDFTKLVTYPKQVIQMATQVLAPFAPHLAEEVWEHLKCEGSLSFTPYPQVEEKYLQENVITYVVQINGKVRGRFDLPKDQTQENVLEAAKNNPHIQQYINKKEIGKVVFVPNKLLSIVLR